MMRTVVIAGLIGLLTAVGTAQEPAPPRRMAPPPLGIGMEIVGFGPASLDEPVTGLPFRAEAETEVTQGLPDGSRIERRFTSLLARDQRGRVRREQPLPPLGPLGPAPEVMLITISDPVQGIRYALDLERRTAIRMALPGNPAARRGAGVSESRPESAARRGPQLRSEDLGARTMAGLRVTGTRTFMTIPAGVFGNTHAIEVVTERWYSPELRIVLSSRRTDPLAGTSVFNVVSLTRGEPPADLFEVPPGFTVTERGPGRRPPPD
jgi:hypothetical protein